MRAACFAELRLFGSGRPSCVFFYLDLQHQTPLREGLVLTCIHHVLFYLDAIYLGIHC